MSPYAVTVAEFETSAAAAEGWPAEGAPEVAFLGRSNVGKSSLINFLLDRRGLVRVSRTPGRTRLVNFFRCELLVGGERRALRLVDLPGFGYAKVAKSERSTWRPTIQEYLERRRPLAAVALLVDARRDPEIDERELAPWLQAHGRGVVIALTKADQLPKHQRKPVAERVRRLLGGPVVATSVLEGEGRDELWRRLLRAALGPDEAKVEPTAE